MYKVVYSRRANNHRATAVEQEAAATDSAVVEQGATAAEPMATD
jgi:hypothetical protein